MKHLFIVNPIAGGSDKTAFVSAKVAQYFSGRKGDFEIYTTKAPMDACDKIRQEAALCNELRVYACGGDGTLNECVNGAAEYSNVAVTCFPTGTGNDFIKMFGADKNRFFDLEALIDGEEHNIDLMQCNERYCLNICSVGIDARIGTEVHKYSKLPIIGGATGYVTSTAVNFLKGIRQEMRVTCDGKLYYGDMSLICACNGQYYGGGFHPVPDARPDDGILDFLVIKGVSRAKFLLLVGKYAGGHYADYPQYITHIRARSMDIDCNEEIVVNVDGEALYTSHLSIRLLPRELRFVFPAQMAFFHAEPEKMKA